MAAALVGALATLTACSGGGGEKTASGTTTRATTTRATARSSSTPGSGASASGSAAVTGATAKLQGSWITTSGGKIVALVITGKKAGLFVTGLKAWCQGSAGAEAGMQMIHLTCPNGNKDRATGMVDSVDAKSMTVSWSGRTGQEKYTKAEGGKLPSAPPTKRKK